MSILLTTLALALAAACGGQGDDSGVEADEDCYYSATELSQGAVPTVTLEEARDAVDFDIRLPAELPPGVELTDVALMDAHICARLAKVELFYEGPGVRFSIREWGGAKGVEPARTPVEVDGVQGDGELLDTPAGPVLLIDWSRDGVTFYVMAFLTDELTQEQVMDILNSIP